MADNFAYAMFYGMKGNDGNGYPKSGDHSRDNR